MSVFPDSALDSDVFCLVLVCSVFVCRLFALFFVKLMAAKSSQSDNVYGSCSYPNFKPCSSGWLSALELPKCLCLSEWGYIPEILDNKHVTFDQGMDFLFFC